MAVQETGRLFSYKKTAALSQRGGSRKNNKMKKEKQKTKKQAKLLFLFDIAEFFKIPFYE